MTDGLDIIAALKGAGVALIGGTQIASGGTESVSAGTGDNVVGLEDTNGTGKGREDEDDGGE
jgi:hypothetical protein